MNGLQFVGVLHSVFLFSTIAGKVEIADLVSALQDLSDCSIHSCATLPLVF